MQNLALITGASSGIGEELARIHAERGGDLLLIARREEKLRALAAELAQQHSVSVEVLARDLARPEAAREVHDFVESRGLEVNALINNAGFGGRGLFHERDWKDDHAMIQLNVVTLTALTRLFLPGMVARKRGRVLNVSSTAALLPGPLQAVYYATKAYVTSLSNALAEELHASPVTVTALMPGATESEFARTADMEDTDVFDKAASAREVAEAGYAGMLAGRLNVIAGVPLGQRLQLAAVPFAPRRMVLRQVRKMQEVEE